MRTLAITCFGPQWALIMSSFNNHTNRAQAIAATKGRGLQAALDWALANPFIPSADGSAQVHEGGAIGDDQQAQHIAHAAGELSDDQAMSLVCEDCGKRFRTPADCELHATRTQHQNFKQSTEEIKPLTDDEKKAKLEELQRKLREKRAAQAAEDEAATLKSEKTRRLTTKEVEEAKRKHEEAEMAKILKDKLREKEEDAKAKAKIREQIAADKAARLAERSGQTIATPTIPVAAPQPTAPVAQAAYATCKLQIRLLAGAPITNTFSPDQTIDEVFSFVRDKAGYNWPFWLKMTRPDRTFVPGDATTLSAAGLVPSAVLFVSRT